MSGSYNHWVENENSAQNATYRRTNYAVGIVGAFILLHSCGIHGWRFNSTRRCTDTAAFVATLTGLFSYLPYNDSSLSRSDAASAIMFGVLVEGVLGIVLHLCDLYLFFSRYTAIQRMGMYEKIFHWIVWIIGGSIVMTMKIALPFFYSASSAASTDIESAVVLILAVGSVIQISYFTARTSFTLLRLSHWEEQHNNRVAAATEPAPTSHRHNQRQDNNRIRNNVGGCGTNAGALTGMAGLNIDNYDHHHLHLHRAGNCDHANHDYSKEEKNSAGRRRKQKMWLLRMKIIAYKCIGHAITSTFGLIFIAVFNPVGSYTYFLLKLVGMHLWFNWPLENYCIADVLGDDDRSLSRRSRERAMFHLIRLEMKSFRNFAALGRKRRVGEEEGKGSGGSDGRGGGRAFAATVAEGPRAGRVVASPPAKSVVSRFLSADIAFSVVGRGFFIASQPPLIAAAASCNADDGDSDAQSRSSSPESESAVPSLVPVAAAAADDHGDPDRDAARRTIIFNSHADLRMRMKRNIGDEEAPEELGQEFNGKSNHHQLLQQHLLGENKLGENKPPCPSRAAAATIRATTAAGGKSGERKDDHNPIVVATSTYTAAAPVFRRAAAVFIEAISDAEDSDRNKSAPDYSRMTSMPEGASPLPLSLTLSLPLSLPLRPPSPTASAPALYSAVLVSRGLSSCI